jgi:hypothetical protein
MNVRVVRFTDVDPARLDEMLARVEGSEGPPPGASATGVQVLVDAEQRTAVVLQMFASAEDMASSEAAFSGMDSSQTPGTRASIDRCELKVDRHM